MWCLPTREPVSGWRSGIYEVGYRIEQARPDDTELSELADVAARTFPLACPPSASPANIANFVDTQLSAARFAEYLADPRRTVLLARNHTDPSILGYAMMIQGVADDPDVQRAVTTRPAVELSKIYLLPEAHGGAAAATLMNAVLGRGWELGAHCVWLGVHQENERAQRFYAKHGFAVSGTKTFALGAQVENDYVMVRPLSRPDS